MQLSMSQKVIEATKSIVLSFPLFHVYTVDMWMLPAIPIAWPSYHTVSVSIHICLH